MFDCVLQKKTNDNKARAIAIQFDMKTFFTVCGMMFDCVLRKERMVRGCDCKTKVIIFVWKRNAAFVVFSPVNGVQKKHYPIYYLTQHDVDNGDDNDNDEELKTMTMMLS